MDGVHADILLYLAFIFETSSNFYKLSKVMEANISLLNNNFKSHY